jgi:hypothetical protein
VAALVTFVLDGADEAAWTREADAICADASAENQALFKAYGPPNSPEVIMTVFGRALENDRRAFARVNALEPPEAHVDEVSRLRSLWRRHLEADESAFAELTKEWTDGRFRDWVGATYPMTVELEQTARRLGSERCGDYFSPDPV